MNALTENLPAPPVASAPAPRSKGRVSLLEWFWLPARLATRQLFFERARLLSAIAGVMFAAVLVFMQLGFRAALFDSATRLYAAMEAELFLMNPLTMASFRPETMPRIRAHQALALPEVAQAVPVYLTQLSWRNPETGAIIGSSPFMGSLIVSIALIFLVCGIAYGRAAGTMRTAAEAIGAIQKAIGALAGLILLLLIISQFIAIFNYSNMATLAAVSMADFLEKLNLPTVALLIGFVIAVFGIDLIITAAIAKWAIFAPVFVPLLMQLGVAPEVVLAAYRVGDSPMNSITPLNAYFAMIVTFAIKYQKDAGVGTVIALMLPYVIAISVIWTALLAAWYMLGLPWGL